MDEKEILQLARECGVDARFVADELIAFANAIRNAALEEAAGIVEDWDSDSADPREVAAAIREARNAE